MERGVVTSIGLILAAVVAGSAIAGCGAQTTRTGEGPPAQAPAQPAAPSTESPRTPEERAAVAAAPESDKNVPGGYRLIKRNGKELYCKSVTTIGTRFEEQMCFTREQIDEIEERTDHAMDDFEQARKTCTGGPYCTG